MYLTSFSLFFYRSGDHRDLHVLTHSFPTRRSSDLSSTLRFTMPSAAQFADVMERAGVGDGVRVILYDRNVNMWAARIWWMLRAFRSEEHTSELQSLMRISYAVFCLKKKMIQ